MALTLIENFRAVFYTPFYAAFALKAYEAEGVEVQGREGGEAAQAQTALKEHRGGALQDGQPRIDNDMERHHSA